VIHVVVGVIRNASGDILIAQRPEGKYKSGLWEFPGGKVEAGEMVFHALQRELKEELNIDVMTAESWLQHQYDYSDRSILLDTWKVITFSGVPEGAEGQAIRWVSPQDLQQFQFPEGSAFILERM